jgi:glycosyltransferase involved in cell wall biosynthesis
MNRPKVSVVMAAYNREDTIARAIDSVLIQDELNWELIIVDDGSTDNTRSIIEYYVKKDSRIIAAFHKQNMHVHSAKNTGFDLMKGEWFTTLDSDDEMFPHALSDMLNVLEDVDNSIEAITCNCLDSTTGEFSGKGINNDQWLDFETLVTKCNGEHWGLTRSSLLGVNRLNCNMRGGAESILWWKISLKAKRYYIHKALRVYHTEGQDRLCSNNRKVNIEDRIGYYSEMSKEKEYLELLRVYKPIEYIAVQRNIVISKAVLGENKDGWRVYEEIKMGLRLPERIAVLCALIGGVYVAKMVVVIVLKARKNLGKGRSCL